MPEVKIEPLGRTPAGKQVQRYRMRAGRISADVMNYGAILMALRAPDRVGHAENIVLGFDALEPYLAGTPYFGAIVGRYANRIAGARFALDGQDYRLAANDGRNHLHGGSRGFDKVVWDAEAFEREDAAGVLLRYVSADGEEGYPGQLRVEVTYTLNADDRLTIDYRAETSLPTHVNLTHHSYFNLSGDALRSVETHELMIEAGHYTGVDAELIPQGAPQAVDASPFDFRAAQLIGARIEEDDPQLRAGGGYDHNFVLHKPSPGALARAAVLRDPPSGRVMELRTTEPGLQFYSGNHLDGSLSGAHGPFARRTGLCLEPQHFPDSPNRPDFPATVLRPGTTYRSRTEFLFSAEG
ncbi:MAG: galactose mutarotase [Phycisphaerales bacterium]|nr:galactose mutarotase [Hyphomonadaceae bacterium]